MSNKNKKLAIEVDEQGHSNYCKQKEKIRENVIRKRLGCDVYRVNPDKKIFDVFKMISEIIELVG